MILRFFALQFLFEWIAALADAGGADQPVAACAASAHVFRRSAWRDEHHLVAMLAGKGVSLLGRSERIGANVIPSSVTHRLLANVMLPNDRRSVGRGLGPHDNAGKVGRGNDERFAVVLGEPTL